MSKSPSSKRGSGRPPVGAASARDALLRAGASYFSTYGYHGANTRSILADAGTTAPALYHHFGNKTGLYIAAATEAQEHVLAVFRDATDDALPLADRVSALLAAAVTLRQEHPNVAKYLSVVQQDVARHSELGELAPYETQFEELWQSVAGADAQNGVAIALRALIEGLLAVGGAELPAASIAAAADVLDRIARSGLDPARS